MKVWAWTDGGNRAEVAACGYVIADAETGEILEERGVRFEGKWTNSDMEYGGVVHVLEAGLRLGVTEMHIHADSEFVVRQVNGEYKIKNEKFRPLRNRVWELGNSYDEISITHIPRELNGRADWLCNEAMGLRKGKDPVRCPPAILPRRRPGDQRFSQAS